MKNKEWGTVLTYPKNGLMKVGVMLNDDSKLPLDRSSPQEKVFEKVIVLLALVCLFCAEHSNLT